MTHGAALAVLGRTSSTGAVASARMASSGGRPVLFASGMRVSDDKDLCVRAKRCILASEKPIVCGTHVVRQKGQCARLPWPMGAQPLGKSQDGALTAAQVS